MNSVSNYLLSAYYVPGIGSTAVNKMDKKVPYLHGALICMGGTLKTLKIKYAVGQ